MALLAVAGNAMADELAIADFSIEKGETKVVSMELNNPNSQYIAFEFWMSLPDGVRIKYDEDNYLMADLNPARSNRHELNVEEEGTSGVYHFLCYSSRNNAFKGDSGEIVALTIECAENATAGAATGQIYTQILSDPDKVEHNFPNYTFNVTIVGDEPVPTYPESLYILGEVGTNTWAPNVGQAMTAGETGKFSATISCDGRNDGYNYFSFTSKLAESASDWDGIADFSYGADVNNKEVVLDEAMAIQKGQNAFKIAAGEYEMAVDLTAMTVTIAAVQTSADKLEIADFSIEKGETKVISMELNNPDKDYIAFEFWMSLPDGVRIKYDEDNYLMAELNSARSNRHELNVEEDGTSGVYHFLCYSSRNNAFKGKSGEIVSLTIECAEDAAAGTVSGQIYNQIFSDPDKNEVDFPDFSFTVTVKGEPVPTYPDELYILGEVNENTWAPNVGLMMTPADSKSLTGEFIASFKADGRNDGYNYLSFSSKLAENADDWAGIADSRYGAEVNNIDVVLDEAMAIQKGENAFKIAAGEYNVEVNLSAGTVKFSAVPVVGPSAPVINPNGGTFENEVTVTITAEEADEIRYTLDGSTPDATSTLYAEPIVLNEVGTHTVKAIALKNGLVSDAVSAEFTITNGGGGGGEMKLTKIWEYKTSGNPANADARFATGFDGKVYVADKAAGEVKVYDADGAKSYAAVEGMGAAITSDDAGNILVNKGFPGATSFNDWVIIKPDGTQTALTIAAPDGVTAARTDQVGRIVGDVMSADGGYMYLAANGQGSVAAIKIANGEQDAEASLASPATGLALNTSFIAQPACETVEDVEAAVDASATFYIRNRTDHKILGWNEDGTELTSLGTVGGGTCEGFDYFFYNDEMYAVAALARTFQFQLKNMTTGEVIAEEGDADALANQFRAYTVRKEGENKFGIYIWNAGGGAAYYVYGKTEGVESVAAESEVVATSYYNLQGVRVNNPAAGQILIKVNTLSNGKVSASKVLVR